MDAMIRDEKDEEKFQQLFAGICDSLNIETLVPLVEENDISSMKQEFDTGYWKNEVKEVLVCPQPFYFLLITPEGVVFPCCEIEANVNVGKITKDDTLVGIWNGERMQKIRSMMLSGKRFEHPECKSCNVVTYQTSKEDNLDSYAEELRIKYEKK
jgi:radical SAM protein with 4Fe4S-binding SPASM domain